VNIQKKSRSTSLMLTLILGPLGLFYSSTAAAIILCVIAIMGAFTIILPIICWLIAIFIGDSAVHKHNKNVDELKDLIKKD